MTLQLPEHFKPVVPGGYAEYFLSYLRGRGFDDPVRMAQRYALHYSFRDKWKWRLIIPFYEAGDLVGWTGRSIDSRVALRYLTLPNDVEAAKRLGSAPAIAQMDRYVWRMDKVLRGGRTLVIVEGPMDALKLDWYTEDRAVVVTCCFGMPKPAQTEFLGRAARGYEKVLVVLDPDAQDKGWALADQIEELSGDHVDAVAIEPLGAEDPGAMSAEQVGELMKRWT